jgi:hypothetical protein
MSKPAHTPGPWMLRTVGHMLCIDDGKMLPSLLARVNDASGAATAMANAKLMCASPDLLAALRMIADSDAQSVDARAIARSAIAKVTK